MDYSAPWWLPGGNLQTIWAALRSRRYLGPAPQFRRERWTTPDSDFVDVDFLVDVQWQISAGPSQGKSGLLGNSALHETKSAGVQPLLVVFHGLEGSSESHYAEAFADAARSRGWACAIPHFRGCSGELNLAPRAYHSGDFAEIDWMLSTFAQCHQGPIVAVGISLGGNALMRWAAEMEGSARQRVAAVASVCSPLDLAASGWAIGRGFNRLVYTRMFLASMVPKALKKLAQHPGLFDRDRLLAAKDLYAFDNIFTAPLHGFKDTDDYWARASAKPHLHRVQLPALALNAVNDPFVPAFSLPTAADVSAHVSLWQPAQGGHVGFPSAPFPGHVRAMPEAVAEFLAQHLPP
ncbi:alpha/beta fold hydrolase [Polaromonas sp. YR568]|uniref:YheT family hydrolase n=1 Tax=Polaromonas sp. YR568 TaxID=1855301 RepID=UPI0031382252